ncbi:hypothetical protein BKA70DRAFT_1354816 [Coprinopsis sp. MPI-PUGE-AT-0042]|nr:hypothetical protein BKA70DRAFT_1354816 [Coprinopsis sp. MPI-PUGE-AT-0042]
MEAADPETGTYALVNTQCSRYALDTKDSIVVAYPYVSSPSQQWNVTTPDGHGLALREVKHKDKVQHDCFQLYVPYSKFVVSMDSEIPKAGSAIFVSENRQKPHQAWYLCKDLHLQTSSILESEDVYRIHNSQSQATITLRDESRGKRPLFPF